MKTQATPKTAAVKKTTAPAKKSSVQEPFLNATTNGTKGTTISQPNADEIAARAYKIWQQQGCPEGCEEQHWRQAEQEIIRDGSCIAVP